MHKIEFTENEMHALLIESKVMRNKLMRLIKGTTASEVIEMMKDHDDYRPSSKNAQIKTLRTIAENRPDIIATICEDIDASNSATHDSYLGLVTAKKFVEKWW